MKRIIRIMLVHILALYLASQIAGGLEFQNNMESLFVAGAAMGLASFTIKPIIKVLLLPLTLATLGLFSFLANVITLYIVDLALNQFAVTGFNFSGASLQIISLPSANYNGLLAYIAFAIIISFITTLVNWLRK